MQSLKDGELSADELFGKKVVFNSDEQLQAKTVKTDIDKKIQDDSHVMTGKAPY